MMDLLRRGARTWVAKLLMGILVLSFGVWGISGTLFSNFGAGTSVIKVGDVEVSPNQFRLAYDREVAAMSQQVGTRLTSQQAKAFGIEGRVYSQLASGATLDQLGRDMGLGLSQDQLAKYIAQDPAFQDSSGNFSRQAFRAVLQNVGMSQKDYILDRTSAAKRSQIIDAVGSGMKPPVTLINAYLQYQNETRDVDYILVSKDLTDPVAAPTDKELQAYFDKHKSDYKAPEYRKIAYVTLTPKDIADPSAVSEDEAKQYYEAHQQAYGTPETRTVDQLVFSDKTAAEAAEAKLKNGTRFDDLVTAENKKPSDVRLGTYSKSDFPDKSLAQAAFSVKSEGGTSGVVQGSFGPVILRVAKIDSAHEKSFSEVEKDVRGQVALETANNHIVDVQNEYEDARAGGATLQEAATKEGLKPVVIDAVDENGETPDGKTLKDLPDSKDLLQAAFGNAQDEDIPSLNYGANGYLWVEVLDITPAHDRALKAVRDKVVGDWTDAQVAAAIAKKAATLEKSVRNGHTIQQVATGAGTSVETKSGIKRSDSDAVFGGAAVNQAFGGPKGFVAVANSASAPDKIVLKVTGIQAGTASGYDALQPRQLDALSQRASNAVFSQMVAMLQSKYGVAVNQKLGEQAIERY